MAVNKVEYGDETLIDLTEDTVSADTLLEEATAHAASGERVVGSVQRIVIDDHLDDSSTNPVQNSVLTSYLTSMESSITNGCERYIKRVTGYDEDKGALQPQIDSIKSKTDAMGTFSVSAFYCDKGTVTVTLKTPSGTSRRTIAIFISKGVITIGVAGSSSMTNYAAPTGVTVTYNGSGSFTFTGLPWYDMAMVLYPYQ